MASDTVKRMDFSAEACAARREERRRLHPVNAVKRAKELTLEFKHNWPWCQKGNNAGNCLLAADQLTRHLALYKITMTSVQFGTYNGKGHAWLEVWDKRTNRYIIIDPTADQFGDDIPEVVCGHISELPEYQYEEPEE